jgi:hypothetical protein
MTSTPKTSNYSTAISSVYVTSSSDSTSALHFGPVSSRRPRRARQHNKRREAMRAQRPTRPIGMSSSLSKALIHPCKPFWPWRDEYKRGKTRRKSGQRGLAPSRQQLAGCSSMSTPFIHTHSVHARSCISSPSPRACLPAQPSQHHLKRWEAQVRPNVSHSWSHSQRPFFALTEQTETYPSGRRPRLESGRSL